MKCPRCGFVSFDELVQCKKCGLYFKEPASAKVSEPKEQRQTQPEESSTSAARLPPQWSETIQSIKKELEEIEGKPIDLKSISTEVSKGAPPDTKVFIWPPRFLCTR